MIPDCYVVAVCGGEEYSATALQVVGVLYVMLAFGVQCVKGKLN